jgi:restriction endonuclease S subunit
MMNILEEIQNCPVEWKELGEVTDTVTSPVKLTKKEYKVSGEIPIVDQGEQFIAGFSDYGKYLKKDEYIIFGDHSEHVKYIDFAFVQGADGLKILKPKSGIKAKYIYYCFCNFYKKEGNYKRHWSKARTTLIPIPQSEEIQEKIVQILDKFTDYVTELTSELTSRKKQYSYYRDKLLSFEDEVYQVEWKKLDEIAENLDSKRKPVAKGGRSSGVYPYYGASGIVDYVNDFIFDGDFLLVSEDGANLVVRKTPIAFSITGKTWVNNHAHVLKFDNMINQKFVNYYLNNIDLSPYISGAAQPKLNQQNLNNIKIPYPSLEIQSRIVQVLDNFDTVCNDLNIGLPKEIELRQKQYEYFRDKLLTFVAEGEYTDSTVQTRHH